MNASPITRTISLSERDITIETGHLAQQASGAVTVRSGETIVLVTATGAPGPRPGVDFMPLTVDFEERLYAVGRIPGSFQRREGRASEYGILSGRLIDRALRPLFPKNWRCDVQVIATVLSADQENDPDVLAIVGASAALAISDIPFSGPIGAVRVGRVNGAFVANPTVSDLKTSDIDLIVAGTADAVLMVEAGAREVPESEMLDAIAFALPHIARICEAQRALADECGKTKRPVPEKVAESEAAGLARREIAARLPHALADSDKRTRQAATEAVKAQVGGPLVESGALTESELDTIFDGEMRRAVRAAVLDRGERVDGRGLDDIRPLGVQVGLLPRAHGSGLFQRGQTQVLSVATLGPDKSAQIIDTTEPVDSKRYMHHYNFPPYSTGEAKPLRGSGRREIGHGALAERALLPVLPSESDFPYTIRVVSEVLSSNGSTSMASTCGSSLALMDAGVPISAPVGGIAMGLITDGDRYAVLTDIQGLEDHLGDMDFKVTGTAKGVTAVQMDIKVAGITLDIMHEALEKARVARMTILAAMNAVIAAPRPELSPRAPRAEVLKVDAEKLGKVIGPSGKTVRGIERETGTQITIEDDGTIKVFGPEAEGRARAVRTIEGLTRDAVVGDIYEGPVTRVMGIGAFMEMLPGKEGLIKGEELSSSGRPARIEDIVKVGDRVRAKVVAVDFQGRVDLSVRAVDEDDDGAAARQRARENAMRRGGPVGASFGQGPRPFRRDSAPRR